MFQLLVCYDFRYVYQVKDGWYFVPKVLRIVFFYFNEVVGISTFIKKRKVKQTELKRI
jgi:hypothetical protein